jgi:dipeptidyl aminopeptidase/acylaminoacyl peptidase
MSFSVARDFIGSGPHIAEGSPTRNAAKISAPVLLFHGSLDRNVEVIQSQLMADRLRDAGKQPELVIYKALDHYLEDGAVRAEMLEKSTTFLKAKMQIK